MKQFLSKLTSRKFIAAVLGIAMGGAMIFGIDLNVAGQVAGAIMAAASAVSYILVEGRIDAESVKNAAEKIQGAIDVTRGEK